MTVGASNQERLVKLISAVRCHRDQIGDSRCHLDDLELYNTLAEITGEDPLFDLALPPKEDFLKSCERYWSQRKIGVRELGEEPGCMTIKQLEDRVAQLTKERDALTAMALKDEGPGMMAELSFNWDRERHSQTPLFLVDMSLLGMKISHLTEYAPYVYFSGEVPIDRVEAIRQLTGVRDLKISKVNGKATREQREAMMAGQVKPGKIEEV
jgi:hypothetical protein